MPSIPAQAERQAQAILSEDPGQPMALLILGASHSALGKPAEALEVLAPLGVSQPGVALVQMELGIALGQLRRPAEAVVALRRAVGVRPDLARAWLALGEQLEALGDQAGADVAKRWHARQANRDPSLAMAEGAIAAKQLQHAETLVRARVRNAPADILAIRMLADLAARAGRDEDACALLQQAPPVRTASAEQVRQPGRSPYPGLRVGG